MGIDCHARQTRPAARWKGGWGCLLALCWGCFRAWADPPLPQTLVLDPDFRPRLTTTAGVHLGAVALQPDGALVVAGRFDLLGGKPRSNVGKLDPYGIVDATFVPWLCVQGAVEAVAIQSDGRILLGGDFTWVGREQRWGLARLNADGTLDESFTPVVEDSGSTKVKVVRVQADGRILIGGEFRSVGHQPRRGIARLKPAGGLDEDFDPGQAVEDSFGTVCDLALLPDGGVVVAGWFTKFAGLARPGLVALDGQGQVKPDFSPALDWSKGLPGVTAVYRQSDGAVLIAGRFDRVGSEARAGLARLLPSGELDLDFQFTSEWTSASENPVRALAVQADARIIVAGEFEAIGDTVRRGIARLEPNGDLDDALDPGEGLRYSNGASATATALALQADGGIVVVGEFDELGAERRHHIGRVLPDGRVDAEFSGPGMVVERVGTVNAVLVQKDGQVLVGGDFERANGGYRQALARFDAAGHLDAGFVAGISAGGVVSALVEQPDGMLLVGGDFETVHGQERPNLARLKPQGEPDPAFNPGSGPNGGVHSIALGPDGQIVLSGEFDMVDQTSCGWIARLNPEGAVDLQFRPRLAARIDAPDVYSIVVQTNGLVVIGGYFDSVNGEPHTAVARLLPGGAPDPEFGRDLAIGGDLPLVTSMALDGLGRLTIAGTFASVNGQPRRGVARLAPDGGLDPSFVPGAGMAGGELPVINAIAFDAGGRLLIAGEFAQFDQAVRENLARLTTDGTVDGTFAASGGMDWWALALGIQTDGGVLVGGPFTAMGGTPRQGLARFKPTAEPFPKVTIQLDHGTANVSWDGLGTLESSASLSGPWFEEPDHLSPASFPPGGSARFYRLVR